MYVGLAQGCWAFLQVQLGFTFCVYPCLTLTYLGQAAMSLERPEAAASAYWESIPSPLTWPMVSVCSIHVNAGQMGGSCAL